MSQCPEKALLALSQFRVNETTKGTSKYYVITFRDIFNPPSPLDYVILGWSLNRFLIVKTLVGSFNHNNAKVRWQLYRQPAVHHRTGPAASEGWCQDFLRVSIYLVLLRPLLHSCYTPAKCNHKNRLRKHTWLADMLSCCHSLADLGYLRVHLAFRVHGLDWQIRI